MDNQSIKNRFGIIGNTPALNHALDTAVQVAATDLSVLIAGESGVGKEAFSNIIHALSSRKHNPFIAVNCGAIPEGTIDSELFGHEKGSFTGAVDARKGYFETVNGGTIFLDEIGEMPLGTQARLLRVLESGEFIRVGSSKVQKTDVRVIAATNRDLLEQAQNGKFREDLYYRLSTVPIRVPALRDRKEDIPLLFRKFTSDFAERYKTQSVQLDANAQQMLMNYPWPGNVRELKNIAEQISVLSTEKNADCRCTATLPATKHGQQRPCIGATCGCAYTKPQCGIFIIRLQLYRARYTIQAVFRVKERHDRDKADAIQYGASGRRVFTCYNARCCYIYSTCIRCFFSYGTNCYTC